MRAGWCVVSLLIPFFFSGCSLFTKEPLKRTDAVKKADNLLSELKNRNDRLQTFKGIGKIKLIDGENQSSARMAWMGMTPRYLRIEIMGTPGHRTASISTDGRWVYLLTYNDHRFYKRRLTDASLEKIISIPVKLNDIYNFLSGRVPIQKHHSVELEKDGDGEQYILVLKSRWWNDLERITIDKPVFDGINKNEITARKVEMFDTTGSFLYRASVDRMKTVNGYKIPFNLSISNEDGVFFNLDIERYWADVPISPNAFVLTPPE